MGYEKGDILKMSRKTNLVAGHDSGYEIVGKYYKIGVAPCHLNFQFVRSVTGQFFLCDWTVAAAQCSKFAC